MVRWINADGLSDMGVIHALATKYELHPLAVEDLLHMRQRAKVEAYGGDDCVLCARLFIVVRIWISMTGACTAIKSPCFSAITLCSHFSKNPAMSGIPFASASRVKAHACVPAMPAFWLIPFWTRFWSSSFQYSSISATDWTRWRRLS